MDFAESQLEIHKEKKNRCAQKLVSRKQKKKNKNPAKKLGVFFPGHILLSNDFFAFFTDLCGFGDFFADFMKSCGFQEILRILQNFADFATFCRASEIFTGFHKKIWILQNLADFAKSYGFGENLRSYSNFIVFGFLQHFADFLKFSQFLCFFVDFPIFLLIWQNFVDCLTSCRLLENLWIL